MTHDDILRSVAVLSFEHGLTNQQVAKALHDAGLIKSPSTRRVQSLIAEAGQWLLRRDQTLKRMEADVVNWDLGEKVRSVHPVLQNVVVVKSISPDDEPLARHASMYLFGAADQKTLPFDEIHVALSGGWMVLTTANALLRSTRPNVHFYASALVGHGRMTQISHVGPEINATIAWLKSGSLPGHLHYGTVSPPDFTATPNLDVHKRHLEAKTQIVEETRLQSGLAPVKQVLSDLEEINMVIADLGLVGGDVAEGIVAAEGPGILRPYGVSAERLAKEGAVGEISYCLFDQDGNSREDWNFFLTAGYPNGIGFLRNMVQTDKVVLVMARIREEPALRAALKGRLFNVLVTDEQTAQALLT